MRISNAQARALGLASLIPRRKRGKRAHEPGKRELISYTDWPGRWELVIPGWRPTTCNELFRSIGSRIRRKKADRVTITAAAFLERIPRACSKRRVSLVITLGPGDRQCDVDAHWKSLLDALKHAGMIVDDTVTWCELGPVGYLRGPGLKTMVRLEDI